MKLLSQPQVLERIGLGRTTLWRMEKAGEFPRRRQVSANRVMWIEAEVDLWIEALPAAGGDEGEVAS